MGYVSKLNSLLLKNFLPNKYKLRLMYTVHHNLARGTFYVKLDDMSKAILFYTIDRKVMDIKSLHVPSDFKGQGIARVLAESALTYAIVSGYYLYLTCEYLQYYYLMVKNFELEERVVGPPHILDGSKSPEPSAQNNEYELPDPEDFMIK